jgi:hypothetical protein
LTRSKFCARHLPMVQLMPRAGWNVIEVDGSSCFI